MRDSVRATRIERRSKVIRRRQGKGQRAIYRNCMRERQADTEGERLIYI